MSQSASHWIDWVEFQRVESREKAGGELETEPNYCMADVTFQTSSLLRHSASAAACFVVSESIEEAVNCIYT